MCGKFSKKLVFWQKKMQRTALKHAYHPQLKTKIIRENNGQA